MEWQKRVDVERLSLKDEKSALRLRFRAEREAFAVTHGKAATASIHKQLRKWVRDQAGQYSQICAYRAVNHEVDPCAWPLTELFFPRLEDGETLSFWRPLKADAFTANKFGILEPSPDAAIPLDMTQNSLVLTPALAVDSLGRRIGSGHGYYDRFFEATPRALRVGVVFHNQVSQDPLPADGWDQLLDWLVTDKMVLRVSRRSS